MAPQQQQFLNLPLLPARLNPEQAAWYLGFQSQDIPLLVAAGLLNPLGHPPPNGTKYLATTELDELRTDRRWLARATDTIHVYWKDKNRQRPPTRNRAIQRNARYALKSTPAVIPQ